MRALRPPLQAAPGVRFVGPRREASRSRGGAAGRAERSRQEVLKQLQGSIEDEAIASSGQIDLLERLKELNLESTSFPGVKLRQKVSVRSYGSREGSVSSRSGECSPVPMGSFPRRGFMNGSRESTGYLEELEKERSLLLAELEKEEKEKDWYYAQLQNLTKRIDSLPLTENFSLQTDMTRRQLEYEARQIRAAMEEQLGTCQDMEKRAQGGLSTRNEMCLSYLLYYPRINLTRCASIPDIMEQLQFIGVKEIYRPVRTWPFIIKSPKQYKNLSFMDAMNKFKWSKSEGLSYNELVLKLPMNVRCSKTDNAEWSFQGMTAFPPEVERPYKTEPVICSSSSCLPCSLSLTLLFVVYVASSTIGNFGPVVQ